MKSCSLHHWILFFIILTPVTSLMANLHHPATLTCNQNCSGVMTWKKFSGYVVARCDQVSCLSNEGFKISHDQYLKGNLDLIIRSVDYSKRTIYTCYCDDKAVCNVNLIIEPLVSAVQKKSGEDLVLDLHITEPMEVDYKNKHTTDLYSEWICNVIDDSLQCRTNYEQRASLSHTELTLRDLKVSDSGVYIIRDIKNKEIIHTYVLSVEEDPPAAWKTPLIVGISVGALCMMLGVVIGWWLTQRRFRNRRTQNITRHEHLQLTRVRAEPDEVEQ